MSAREEKEKGSVNMNAFANNFSECEKRFIRKLSTGAHNYKDTKKTLDKAAQKTLERLFADKTDEDKKET